MNAPLSPVEILKANSHGLRGTLVDSLADPVTGARRRWLTATGCVGQHLGARLAAVSDIPVVILPVGTMQS